MSGVGAFVDRFVAGRPPLLTDQSVLKLVTTYFKFGEVTNVKALPGYYDRNYYFRGKREGVKDCEFVLKTINPLAAPYEVIEGIAAVMNHLLSTGFPCPLPILGDRLLQLSAPELTGVSVEEEATGEGMKYPVYVLTYIRGEILNSVDKTFLTPSLFREVGEHFGRLDKELMDNFPVDTFTSKVSQDWDLLRFTEIQQYFGNIEDTNKRRNAEKVVKSFEEFVTPKLPSFRRGIIHADLTGTNVIVVPGASSDAAHRVAGVIDFNDSIHTCIVFELGVSLTHIMRDHMVPGAAATDIVERVGPLVSGYCSSFPLTQDELDSLYYIVLARCVFVAINSERVCRSDPENTVHVVSTIKKNWDFIHHMLSIPKAVVDDIWMRHIKEL